MDPVTMALVLKVLDLAAMFYTGWQEHQKQTAVTNTKLDEIYALKSKFANGVLTTQQLIQKLNEIDNEVIAAFNDAFNAMPKPAGHQ